MTDPAIVTVLDPDRNIGLRARIAVLDWGICERLHEIERLQNELHDLEIKQANLLNELGSEED